MSETNAKAPTPDEQKAAAGEPMVWLSGMGLTMGLLLIIGLLGVIFVNGVPYFWPKRVAEVTLAEGATVPGIDKKFAGELRMQRTRSDNATEESQYYLGNRDIYGFSFKFVDDNLIAEKTYPEELISIEREEYGRAIGYPIKLVLADGSEVEAGSEEFDSKLESLIDEVTQRRHDIERIAKGKIGKINKKLDTLKFDEIKMNKPAVQNDFSYYRRTIQRTRNNSSSKNQLENPIEADVANAMSLFFAHATPMLNALSAVTSEFVRAHDGGAVAKNTTQVLSLMATVNYYQDLFFL